MQPKRTHKRGNITLELWPCGGARVVAEGWDVSASAEGKTGGSWALDVIAGELERAAESAREEIARLRAEVGRRVLDEFHMTRNAALARAWADELEAGNATDA